MGDGVTLKQKAQLFVFPSSFIHLYFAYEEQKTMEPVSRQGGDHCLRKARIARGNLKYIHRQLLFKSERNVFYHEGFNLLLSKNTN